MASLAGMAITQESGEWSAAGHDVSAVWIETLGGIGALALLVVFLFLIARAFVRRRRYRAAGVLTEADLQRVHAELIAAEKRTVGEIVPVVLERSDRHPAALWLSAVVFLLLGSALLAPWLPWDRPLLLLLAQGAFGALGYATARLLPDFQRLFIRESRATEMAEEQAFQEFYRHGLHRTEARTGVLLFVTLLERRAIVLADEGIDAVVKPEQWSETDAAILKGITAGSLRDGLIAGIRNAADLLAEHFPWEEGDRNEVPDRLIVRRE